MSKVLQSVLHVTMDDLGTAERHIFSSSLHAQPSLPQAGSKAHPPDKRAQVGQKRSCTDAANEQAVAESLRERADGRGAHAATPDCRASKQGRAPVQNEVGRIARRQTEAGAAAADEKASKLVSAPVQNTGCTSRGIDSNEEGLNSNKEGLTSNEEGLTSHLARSCRHPAVPESVGAAPFLRAACTALGSGHQTERQEIECAVEAWNVALDRVIWDAKAQAALEVSGISSAHDLVGICQDLCSMLITGALTDLLVTCAIENATKSLSRAGCGYLTCFPLR
jgi:hypothetical protein